MTTATLAAAIYDRLHVTHQWRRTNLSPRFWLIGGPIRPCADRKQTILVPARDQMGTRCGRICALYAAAAPATVSGELMANFVTGSDYHSWGSSDGGRTNLPIG